MVRTDFADLMLLIRSLTQNLYNQLGLVQVIRAENFMKDICDVSAEAKQELADLHDARARKNCNCSFYRVKNIETFTIAAEDLDQDEVMP